MVNGNVLKFMAEYVESKKGISGIEQFQKTVNEKNVIIPKLESIDPEDEFSAGYFERVFEASAKVLNDEKLLTQFGFNYGKKFSIASPRIFSAIEKNQKIIDSICDGVRKYLPTFTVSCDSLSDKKFILRIGNVKSKEESLFISGYLDAVLQKIQKKIVKTEEYSGQEKKVVLRFL
ncbi:MAG: hypothetical protein ACP5F1_02795 [Thermoplasmata archaeon]|nr:hypothetical protein [Thermoplasmata archaeon]